MREGLSLARFWQTGGFASAFRFLSKILRRGGDAVALVRGAFPLADGVAEVILKTADNSPQRTQGTQRKNVRISA